MMYSQWQVISFEMLKVNRVFLDSISMYSRKRSICTQRAVVRKQKHRMSILAYGYILHRINI